MLIKACLNGGRSRTEHPAVPISPGEIAADARAVAEAGADAVHVHARDGRGRETVDPAACGEVVAAVRRAVPELPVGLTTGAWIAPHPRRLRLIERWDPTPDFASVNITEDGAGDLCRVLADRGIGAEAGVESAEDVGTLRALGGPWLRVLVEIDEEEDGDAAVADAAATDDALEAVGVEVPRLHHAFGKATWAVLRAAVPRGRDVRIGLEDTLVMPDGSPARDNAALVRAAAGLAGRAP